MRVLHKIKKHRKKGMVKLINADGSWNIVCKTKSSHLRGTEKWKDVTCKRCLKAC